MLLLLVNNVAHDNLEGLVDAAIAAHRLVIGALRLHRRPLLDEDPLRVLVRSIDLSKGFGADLMTFGVVVYDQELDRLYHLLLSDQIANVAHRPPKHLGAELNSGLAGRDADQLVIDVFLLELETDSLLVYVAVVDVED